MMQIANFCKRHANTLMRPVVFAGAGLLLASCAEQMAAADPAQVMRDLAEACGRSICRSEIKQITLNAPNNNVAQFNTGLLPYADAGTVAIYPGESFKVRLRVQGDKLGEPVFDRADQDKPLGPLGYRAEEAAKAAEASRATPVEALIYLSFKQDGMGGGMSLELQSDLPVTIKYDAVMFMATPGGIRPSRTSSCPLLPHAGAHETWPQPLTMLLLSNFRVLNTDQNFVCQ